MTLRWRIALAFAALTAALLAGLWLWVRAAVLSEARRSAAERLLAEAHLAAAIAPPSPWQAGPALQSWAEELDERLGVRVTLIGPEGLVLADSRRDPGAMESHADRPEWQAAVREGQGTAVRLSRTLDMEMVYAAVRAEGADPGYVVRIALPLDSVRLASRDLRRGALVAFAVAAGSFLLLAGWLASALTAPVRRLAEVARRVGEGDLEARAPTGWAGELRELAEAFNAAVGRLGDVLGSSERAARRYAAILEQMGDAVVIVDDQRRIELINHAFGRVFGRQRGQTEGKYLDEVALNYDLSELMGRALAQGTVQRGEVRVLHPQTRTLVGVATPLLAEDDRIVGAVGLLRDVSEIARVEEVRREFVANASHELRTPAASIRALAEALESGALEDHERAARFVRQIVEASDRLTRILDDMLVLTRVERGQELLRREWLSAAAACREALGRVEHAASRRAVGLTCEVGPADRVYADPGSLQTMLVNLLDNAVKYTPTGGRVVLRGREVPGGYELSVEDTGPGIPDEEQERVFERFYRVDRARDRATGGTGLGLSIVKHTAEAHGGSVTLRSSLGEGSTFTVFLPQPEPQAG